jgi:hypothetical protein
VKFLWQNYGSHIGKNNGDSPVCPRISRIPPLHFPAVCPRISGFIEGPEELLGAKMEGLDRRRMARALRLAIKEAERNTTYLAKN